MMKVNHKAVLAAMLLVGMFPVAKCNAQESAETVIRKTREKCQSIKEGHYEVEYKVKYMSSNDTLTRRLTCDFKKLPDDTIFKKAFALTEKIIEYKETFQDLYTGNEFVHLLNDTATIMSCNLWADEIIATRHNYTFYTPLTDENCYPVPSEEKMADSNYSFSLSETRLDGKPCYLLDILGPEDKNDYLGIRSIRYEMNLWIDKEEYLPRQYSVALDIVEQQDTMYQYDEFKLLSFEPKVDESKLTIAAIPDSMVLKDYAPEPEIEPLADGTPAPEWALPSLTGDTVRMADLKGKVVLVDFFYKSCAPCCAALPALQRIHEKYKDRGFVMIGIDPYDGPAKDEMSKFLTKRGVTYTVLFSDRALPETYRVRGYPTLYLIDREGKIVKTQFGYSSTMEEELEKQIQKMLE